MALASTPQQTVAVSLSSTSPATVTIASAPAGSVLVFAWGILTSGQTVTPSCPNTTWTLAVGGSVVGGTYIEMWIGVVAGGATGTTVTFTASTSSFSTISCRGWISEWRGSNGIAYLAATNSGSSVNVTTPDFTPVAGKNAAYLCLLRASSAPTWGSPTNSFTDPNISGSSAGRGIYRVDASAAGTAVNSVDVVSPSVSWVTAGFVLYDTAPSGTMTFTTQPTTATSGVAMSSVVVTADVAASGLTCTLTLSGPNGSAINLTAVHNGSGVATFTPTVTGDGPGYSFSAATSGYTTVVSSTFTTIGTAVAANQALVTALGGDALLFSVHDTRVLAAGAVASFPDSIGLVGSRVAGLTFTQATGASKPTAIGSAGGMTLDGVDDCLASAADARLTLGGTAGTVNPIHCLVIAKMTANGAIAGFAADPTSAVTYPFQVLTAAGGTYAATVGSDGAAPSPTVANTAGAFTSDSLLPTNDGKIRAFTLGKMGFQNQNNVDHTYVFVPGSGTRQARWHRRVTTATAGSCKGTIGRFGATFGTGTVYWIGYFAGDLSSAVLRAFWAFARAQFGATVDTAAVPTLLLDGNSLSLSTTAIAGGDMVSPVWASGTTSLGYYLAHKNSGLGTLVARGIDCDNPHSIVVGASGRNIQNRIDCFAQEIGVCADGLRTGPIVILWIEAGNSVQGLGYDAAAYLAKAVTLKGLCDTLASSAGVSVRLIHITDPDRGDGNSVAAGGGLTGFYTVSTASGGALSTNGTVMQTINSTRVSSPATYGYATFDLEQLSGSHFAIGILAAKASYDATYYNSPTDKTHLSPTGYQLAGEAIKTGLFDVSDSILFPSGAVLRRRRR